MDQTQLDRIEAHQRQTMADQAEIKTMLVTLLDALADEGDEEHGHDLDGNPLPAERDMSQPL